MNLMDLSELLLNEKKAEKYLLNFGILKTFNHCEKCGSEKLGRIRRGRYKCYGCKNEWSVRKGSILYNNNLSYSKLIGIIKMFELNVHSITAAVQLDLNRNTINSIYILIRQAIAYSIDISESYQNKNINISSYEYSISEVDGKIKIELFIDENYSDKNISLQRSRNTDGNIMYIIKNLNKKKNLLEYKSRNAPVIVGEFINYLRQEMLKYQGISEEYLFLYLKEIEFRFNNRSKDLLFNEIVRKLAEFEGWLHSRQGV